MQDNRYTVVEQPRRRTESYQSFDSHVHNDVSINNDQRNDARSRELTPSEQIMHGGHMLCAGCRNLMCKCVKRTAIAAVAGAAAYGAYSAWQYKDSREDPRDHSSSTWHPDLTTETTTNWLNPGNRDAYPNWPSRF